MNRLESERLILRRFREEDTVDLHEYLSVESVVQFEPYGVFSLEACREEAKNRSVNPAFWAVCLRDSGKLIGNIYFQQQEPKDFRTWEVGYVFNPLYGGKGYATEASRRILRYGFEEQLAHRIIAHCNPENIPSWKLLERLSMRREGHYKKPIFFKRTPEGDPIWQDGYEYAILRDEWLK